ncbi:MAG: hypothetical protein JNL21_38590 [Myxococcales bacterium]|nr:hypothetical protein [Myxococcales bacterium]
MLGAVDLVQPAVAPILFESGQADRPRSDGRKLVVSAVGSFSCCDVWFSVPVGVAPQFRLHVYGRVGDVRFLLVTVTAGALPVAADGAREGTLAAVVRGRPSTAFEVEYEPLADVTGVNVFVQAWHADVTMDVTGIDRSPLAAQMTASARTTFSRGSDRVLSLAAAAASNTILGALWNPSSSAKRVELQRIELSFWGASTSGAVRIRARRITAIPTIPMGGGGATLTAEKHDSTDAAPSAQLFVNANAPAWGGSVDFWMVVLKPAEAGRYTWTATDAGKPLVLRQNEGLEVRAVTETAMASAMSFGINMQWVEI